MLQLYCLLAVLDHKNNRRTLNLGGSTVKNRFKTQLAHPQMALTPEMRTEGGWLSWRPLTVAWRNCWMSSGDMAVVKRLAAHRARPRRNGDAAGQENIKQQDETRQVRMRNEASILPNNFSWCYLITTFILIVWSNVFRKEESRHLKEEKLKNSILFLRGIQKDTTFLLEFYRSDRQHRMKGL